MKMSILMIFLMLFAFAPAAFAQDREGRTAENDIVSCDGVTDKCDWCDIIQLVDNVIDFLFIIFTLAAVGMVMYVGFTLVTSRGNSEAWTKGKGMFTNLVIGFVIFLSGWLIVDTVLKMLIKEDVGFGVWNDLGPGTCDD